MEEGYREMAEENKRLAEEGLTEYSKRQKEMSAEDGESIDLGSFAQYVEGDE